MKAITIKSEYITLGQLLKFAHVVDSGGEVKNFLTNTKVLVNGLVEQRRGKKIKVNDIVSVNNQEFIINHEE